MLGNYKVEITSEGESPSLVFKVEDYRKPDYRLTLTPDSSTYVVGDEIHVSLEASYFFGQAVPAAHVPVMQYELGENYCWWEGCSGEDYIWFNANRPMIQGRTNGDGRWDF